jgi:hypothetical protein
MGLNTFDSNSDSAANFSISSSSAYDPCACRSSLNLGSAAVGSLAGAKKPSRSRVLVVVVLLPLMVLALLALLFLQPVIRNDVSQRDEAAMIVS